MAKGRKGASTTGGPAGDVSAQILDALLGLKEAISELREQTGDSKTSGSSGRKSVSSMFGEATGTTDEAKLLEVQSKILESREKEVKEEEKLLEFTKLKEDAEKRIAGSKRKMFDSERIAAQKRKAELEKEYKTQLEIAEAQVRAGKTIDDATRKRIQELGGSINGLEKTLDRVDAQQKAVDYTTDKIKNTLTQMTSKAFQFALGAFSPTAVLDTGKAYEKLRADFQKTTGASKEFTEVIRNSVAINEKFSLSVDESNDGWKNLYNSYDRFSAISDDNRKELFKTTTTLERLGLPMESSVKTMSKLNTVFGMTPEKAIKVQKDLTRLAIGMKTPVAQLTEQFTNSMEHFMIYGDKMGDQFEQMSKFARNAGMDINELTGLTEKLSTFEGAGEFAGKINSLSGMMIVDPAKMAMLEGQEQLDYVERSLKEAFGDFNTMNSKQKLAIKHALSGFGISLTSAGKIINSDQEAKSKLEESVGQAKGISDEGLVQRAQDATDAFKLKADAEQATIVSTKAFGDALEFTREKLVKWSESLTEKAGSNAHLENLMGDNLRLGLKGGKLAAQGGKALAQEGSKMVGKILGKEAAKEGAKVGAKVGGKTLLKRIPILGSLVGAGFAVKRFMEGDTAGGFMELGSAGLGLLDIVAPGVGTAASLAADAAIAARDMGAFGSVPTPTEDGIMEGGSAKRLTKGSLKGKPRAISADGRQMVGKVGEAIAIGEPGTFDGNNSFGNANINARVDVRIGDRDIKDMFSQQVTAAFA